MDRLELIEALSNAYGPSGFEEEAADAAAGFIPEGCSVERDGIRNVYIKRKKASADRNAPKVVFDAHIDEVGFIVQRIEPNGTLAFLVLGSISPGNIPAHRVRVLSSSGKWIPGVVAAKPPHFMTEEERKKPLSTADMRIDVGASSAEEVEKYYGIRPGAPAVPDVVFECSDRGIMLGKAFDDRLGCAAVISVMNAICGEELGIEPVGVLSTQEEVGERGATVAAQRVKPDLAICFEGCPADDTVLPENECQTVMGKGPMLRHSDISMITHPGFQRYALDIAREHGIPVQEAVRSGGGTNGAAYQMAGAPSIVIGVPVRYAHSHHCFSSLKDFDSAVELGVLLARSLDRETVDRFIR
ncbi:MAG: M42 family metallopeptidase [Oscillospiraceae bacterium]|jgi:putative aminopeptidase FrvX